MSMRTSRTRPYIRQRRRRNLITILVMLALGAGVAWLAYGRTRPAATIGTGQAQVGGPFTLVDMNGQTVTESVLNGQWSAMFFGFTHCPDVCPLTLNTMADVQKTLSADKKPLRVVFISVDPARDTPEVMKTYLSSDGLPTDTLGLTGSVEQVAAITKAYRVYYRKAGDGADYMIDHSGVIYLMAPDGKLSAVASADEAADVIAGKFKTAIAQDIRL